MTEFIPYIFFLIVGGIIAWMLRSFQLASNYGMSADEAKSMATERDSLKNETARLEERIRGLDSENQSLKDGQENLRNLNTELERDLSSRKSDLKNLQEKLDSQKQELQELHQRMTEQFKNLANEILDDKSRKFTEQNRTQIDQLLKPLGEKIQLFEKKVEETYDKETRDKMGLREQIKQLAELNQKMSDEARNLTKALKGDSKTQGNWGEVILERILERSGLNKGQEYNLQYSQTTEDGKRLQPDVVINLPDNKHLVVDAKVSLTAYERMTGCEDKSEQEAHLKQHIQSIKTHVKSLNSKNYTQLFDIGTPEFVLMFIPVEPAFGLAMMNEPGLYTDAFDLNIVIVSPSTLLATMATIKNIWKYEYQNRNALQIAEEGGKLYDKFVGFVDDLEKVGSQIDNAQKSWEKAMNKMSTGRGNLVRKAEQIREMGIKASKKLPDNLLLESGEDEDDRE